MDNMETWHDTYSCPRCGALEEVVTSFPAEDMELAKLGSSHAANTTQRAAKIALDREREVKMNDVRAKHVCASAPVEVPVEITLDPVKE